MKAVALYRLLWQCATREEVLDVLKREPHASKPIGPGTRNNKSNIKTTRDSIAAVIEGVTNGHDAMTLLYNQQGRFPTPPKSVSEAMAFIAADRTSAKGSIRPGVHVLLQTGEGKFKNRKNRACTIIDEGVGMTANGLINGPLAFGAEDKVLRRDQFGSFGQGGASLFGHSAASIIASRRAGTDTVVFTVVWQNLVKGEHHTYLYCTRPNGELFSFNAAELSEAVTSASYISLKSNTPILPPQGTIRRQLQMEIGAYYEQREVTNLYYGLTDRLFGCPGYVRLLADDDDGHSNNRRGRRFELSAIAEGAKLRGSQAVMLKHLPPSKVALFHKTTPIGHCHFETWVVSSWMTKGGAKKAPELATPALKLLEGKAPARSIFVTYNGQTHARLASSVLFGHAGLREIADNIILEVTIDDLDPDMLRDADMFLSTRAEIVDWFERVLNAELLRYLKAQEDLKALVLEMRAAENAADIGGDDLNAEVNKVLANPIFGRGLGFPVWEPGMVTKEVDVEILKDKSTKKAGPLQLVDPPTFIEIRKATVVRHATNYVTINTDAKNRLGPKIELDLPPFLSLVQRGKLSGGRMTCAVACDASPIGTLGEAVARLRSTDLESHRNIEIVPRGVALNCKKELEGGKLETQVPGNVLRNSGPPRTELRKVTRTDPSEQNQKWYSRFFGMSETGSTAALNYHLIVDDNVLSVGVNIEFEPMLDMHTHLEKQYGPVIGGDYIKRVCNQLQVNAMVFCRNSLIGPQGATDDSGLEILADMTRGIAVWTCSLYRDRAIRNAAMVGKADE